MKKKVVIASLIALTSTVFGMGERPDYNLKTGINVSILDSTNHSYNLENLNCEGNTFIHLKEGTMRYRINLKDIKEIDVINPFKNEAKVITKNGKIGMFSFSPDLICYGDSSFGNASFYVKDVKKILFLK